MKNCGPLHKQSGLLVAVSTVANGTMSNRHNPTDSQMLANRQKWLSSLQIDMNRTTLVRLSYDRSDYCRYRTLGINEFGKGMYGDDIDVADALVTTDAKTPLFLPLADCIGAVLYDENKGVLMMTHLGRHNLEQNGALQSVHYLRDNHQVEVSNLKVWLSPAVGKETYPVYTQGGKGLKELAFDQFAIAGVPSSSIVDYDFDTATHPDYFSHSQFLKGKGTDGRFAIVAMMPSRS